MKFINILTFPVLFLLVVVSACYKAKPLQVKNVTLYTCPMHPQVLENHPGNCPICNMELIKKSGQASEGTGISLKTVLKPVNSFVISGVKAITPEIRTVQTQVTAQGYLDFDSRTFNNIASRYSGRIERLYVKYAFQDIVKGQPLFEIYSPEMVTAQQDYIFLVKNSPQETGLINAARQKLLIAGMTAGQINQILNTGNPIYKLTVYSPYNGHVHDSQHSLMADAGNENMQPDFEKNLPLTVKEGMYVEKGQNLFNVADAHHLWAVLKIDNAAYSMVKLHQTVTISIPDIGGEKITGKVGFIEPMLRPDDKNTTIRVYLDNMDHSLKVNSQISAVIATGETKGLWVPKPAVTYLGKTAVAWLKKDGGFQARQVFTGTVSGNYIRIISGLTATDSVAANAQYLTDSESFIKLNSHE